MKSAVPAGRERDQRPSKKVEQGTESALQKGRTSKSRRLHPRAVDLGVRRKSLAKKDSSKAKPPLEHQTSKTGGARALRSDRSNVSVPKPRLPILTSQTGNKTAKAKPASQLTTSRVQASKQISNPQASRKLPRGQDTKLAQAPQISRPPAGARRPAPAKPAVKAKEGAVNQSAYQRNPVSIEAIRQGTSDLCVSGTSPQGQQPLRGETYPPRSYLGDVNPQPWLQPRAKPESPRRDWLSAMETEYEELTGQLEAIKNVGVLTDFPHNSGAHPAEHQGFPQSATRQILQPLRNPLVEPDMALPNKRENAEASALSRPQMDASRGRNLAACAQSLFDDPEFAELCDKGMNMQLQRTKNGATDKSRIAELAALVKLLRRCLKEMSAKSTAFVNTGLEYERGTQAQIEAIKLSCDSRIREVEVEVAGLRRDASQASASHKQATASWQIQLDHQRVETSRAQRDLERMTAERDKARDEARRAMDGLAVLEGNAKGMKKEAGLQLRELQADVGETRRTMQDMQDANSRREAELQMQISTLEQEREAAKLETRQLTGTLRDTEQELEGSRQELAALMKAKDDLLRESQRLAAGLSERERMNEEMAAQNDSSASEVVVLRQRCTDLAQQLSDSQHSLKEATQEASNAAQQHSREASALSGRIEVLQEEAQALAREHQNLGQQNKQLSVYIDEANSDCRKLSADLMKLEESKSLLAEELQVSQRREAQSKEELAQAREQVTGLEAELADVRQQVQNEIESKQAMIAESSVKAARLARLEGEFEAMQDAIGTGSIDQAEMLGRLISRVASLEAAVAESQCVRRSLHNQLVNLRGNVRVFCRLRPHPNPALACLTDGTSVKTEVDGKDQIFSFDRVFGAAATQQQVFDEVSELVQSALDGYQVCLFSYGQTGAGKTHTMQGGKASESQGIIPRAVAKILEEAKRLEGEGWEYELEASFVEVYNESLRDLLAEGKGRDVGKLPETNVIKHHPTGGPSTVVGAVRTKVRTTQDAAALVRKASSSRAVEATAMNAVSSRSHSIFMLYICGHHPGSSTHLLGGLNLVDLAGSERLNRSQVEGQRQKEACSINKSLSALGDVFSALAARNPHVPYRNSKLTHLLQPCLGGDGKTLMFVNVNPEADSLQETICSLRFATKVNACQTAARGGAKRHMSVNGETRSSLQDNKRQTLQGMAAGAKRKALTGNPQKNPQKITKPRLK